MELLHKMDIHLQLFLTIKSKKIETRIFYPGIVYKHINLMCRKHKNSRLVQKTHAWLIDARFFSEDSRWQQVMIYKHTAYRASYYTNWGLFQYPIKVVS